MSLNIKRRAEKSIKRGARQDEKRFLAKCEKSESNVVYTRDHYYDILACDSGWEADSNGRYHIVPPPEEQFDFSDDFSDDFIDEDWYY